MAQKTQQVKPLFLNLDTDFSKIKPQESPYLKSVVWDINANPADGNGTNNPTQEGQNLLAISTTRSVEKIPYDVLLDAGTSIHAGAFESAVTNEIYHCVYNTLGFHGVYVVSGDTGVWQRVIIDPALNFSDDPEAFIATHRATIRLTKGKDGAVIEKHLLLTDGKSWQKYINVIAAIRTNGFDASTFPYWTLTPPHFDRRELVEWAVRPPLIRPEVTLLANTPADISKIGQLADKAFQFAISHTNTDGRQTHVGLYSLPLIVRSSDYQNDVNNIPKNAKLVLPAGSPLTEKTTIYFRRSERDKSGVPDTSSIAWGDWYIYDVINKFTSSGANAPDVIGNDYWLRTQPWQKYNYDAATNTIEYVFDNSKVPQLVSQEYIGMIESGMPQLSVGMTDLGDAVLLGDNRYGYDNFSDELLEKLDVDVIEKQRDGCNLPLRNIYLYAYVGRCGDEFSYLSQVGFYLGDDKTARFGGLTFNEALVKESETFGLNFADKQCFQVYLKGTPYTAVGEWGYVTTNNTFVKLDKLYDFSVRGDIDGAQAILANGNYFCCRFKLTVPSGKYIACMGRHNVKISDDYRSTSTYVYGIANSRVKSSGGGYVSIKPDAINSTNGILYSKEMELDCTNGDVDVWGNGADLFYIYCPYETRRSNRAYRFIEGYFRESAATTIPVETFSYQMTHAAQDDGGRFTDKNGFYWAYTKVRNSGVVDVEFYDYISCQPTYFRIQTTQGGIGWRQNAMAYLENYNNGTVGDCNRVVVKGRITSLDGLSFYSNVAISIKDGMTAYTKLDGTFTMFVHNGTSTTRVSNIYVNASGNFIITTQGCGQPPLFNYNDSLVPCNNCSVRNYPIPINLAVKLDYISQNSLKEGASYSIALYGMDYAGRTMYANQIKTKIVPSFLKRNNTNATFFRMLINGALQLNKYPDIKWVVPTVSKNLSQRRYLDWVGDFIKYIDRNGNVVTDSASAVFCAISITSLYDYNVANNFSVLSTYQFVQGDRLRIYDNGDNQLFDTNTFGEPIDIEIYGTNFNAAAINAGLVPPSTNTVFNATSGQTAVERSVNLIVQYDSRLDKLIDKIGFWIETYTPTKESDVLIYQDAAKAYPVINGEVAEYTGGGPGNPQYNYPSTIDLDYWDTYLFPRNIIIPNSGSKYFTHIFQSPNITDNWGKEVSSGGRRTTKNDNAKQRWFGGGTARSEDFVKDGQYNGLAFFYPENRRDFSTYPFGDIVAMKSERNIIAIICENDWFTVDYNYHYVFANDQGVMITNLSEGLSTPHQKMKGKYGLQKEDTGTFVVSEEGMFWLDNRNTGFIKCDFKDAIDISQLSEELGERGGIQSYLNSKLEFINKWNTSHPKERRFDSRCGIDQERGNVYLTFRNRRNNSVDHSSFANTRRGIDLKASETIVYSIQYHGWLRFEGFAPEGYCRLRGKDANVEMYSFVAATPYRHNNTDVNSFLDFYGVQCEPVIQCVFNDDDTLVKQFNTFAHDSNPNGWFVDMIYTPFINSFSYLSANQFKKKENMFYAAVMRNMNSYPSNNPAELFRSTLFDGYRVFGRYAVARFVGAARTLNKYNEVNNIYASFSPSGNNKK